MTNYWFLWLGPGTPLLLAGLVWWIIELFPEALTDGFHSCKCGKTVIL